MSDREPRIKVIIDNLFEIMWIGGKLLISYIRDGVNVLSSIWKDDHLLHQEMKMMEYGMVV